jgi:hypothetical protein
LVDTVEADAMQVFVQMRTLIQMLIDGHGSINGWPCCYIGLYVSRSLVVHGAGNGIQCISQGGI